MYILNNCLRAHDYTKFLKDHIYEILEYIPINVRQRMYFEQDGASHQNERKVTE